MTLLTHDITSMVNTVHSDSVDGDTLLYTQGDHLLDALNLSICDIVIATTLDVCICECADDVKQVCEVRSVR